MKRLAQTGLAVGTLTTLVAGYLQFVVVEAASVAKARFNINRDDEVYFIPNTHSADRRGEIPAEGILRLQCSRAMGINATPAALQRSGDFLPALLPQVQMPTRQSATPPNADGDFQGLPVEQSKGQFNQLAREHTHVPGNLLAIDKDGREVVNAIEDQNSTRLER